MQHAALECRISQSGSVLGSGGWCLEENPDEIEIQWNEASFKIPYGHVPASERIVKELIKLIESESIQSLNDFGAGVGQYEDAILREMPNFNYSAYDGAGNIGEYTNGFVDFFDLTVPLALPKADWVISLEVGEHIPSKYEGMFFRNLHRHNRKGIILSWGVLNQNGRSHVNNHGNEYLVSTMESLGYEQDLDLQAKFRNSEGNYKWFENSLMVFRRLAE